MSPRKDSVVSLLQIPSPSGEVLLEVKFADVDRSILSQLGANILSTSPAKTVFTTSTGQFSPPSIQSGQTINWEYRRRLPRQQSVRREFPLPSVSC